MKYIVIGGNPFTMYTGTETFTGLTVVGKTYTIEEAKEIFRAKYEECGGLMLIVDMETGSPVEAELGGTK